MKKAAGEMFAVRTRIITYGEDGKRDTLGAPTITTFAGPPAAKISVGGERTIAIAPKTTETVFAGRVSCLICTGCTMALRSRRSLDIATKTASDGLGGPSYKFSTLNN